MNLKEPFCDLHAAAIFRDCGMPLIGQRRTEESTLNVEFVRAVVIVARARDGAFLGK